jgi:hypothetical protein
MTATQDWRAIVASSLGWEQAHATLENSVKGLAPSLQGVRPTGYPHSAWELLEHIRITQRGLLPESGLRGEARLARRLLAADTRATDGGGVGTDHC